ncbi:Piso0_001905 [Millerozyma farinosa CBS 7064]|uniref:General negative regulator of transcription subunit n=1 Tax=Pichia sorbitophila (strain ATCC MYA-4447 / BCRC 22081 / CBS 7064 / NBRC 10061 / NRRL Y-12695) TaxID=559304 RepID=G8YB61_PICSO|nr:Piso0_001905 [Millerozyma farinosa CBS 7064]
MSHRKLQKEAETIFKKINEGVELFNYYYSRHQSSNSDSQREKLEGDLKKEIKKLQKYRDQIKTWQSNESVEAAILPSKLHEHRRMVEEAMECYKEVEKNSKMKSYSNQSIMLAALEQDQYLDLSPEAESAMEFLNHSIDELARQNEELESEYEKLSQKKIRKKNSTMIEERKQEIDSLSSRNKFHMEKLSHIVDFLKRGKVDPDSVMSIQEDINFYLESNQDPDFVDDENLYDELVKEVESNLENSSFSKDPARDNDVSHNDLEDKKLAAEDTRNSTTDLSNEHAHETTDTVSRSVSNNSSSSFPIRSASTPQKSSTPAPPTPESSSPAIVKNLKFSTAPTNPVGNIKWSTAAASGPSPTPSPINYSVLSNTSNGSANNDIEDKTSSTAAKDNGSQELPNKFTVHNNERNQPQTQERPQTYDNSKSKTPSRDILEMLSKDPLSEYVEILRISSISSAELDLFSDLNLIKLPPGIQDLVISFTATRKVSTDDSRFILGTLPYKPYSTPIRRPFLPDRIQSSINQYLAPCEGRHIDSPLHISKFQSYWNHIRANNKFEQFLKEIQLLSTNPENSQIVNELTMVFFYGYYYGATPIECLIAETCLFKLNWKPYGPSNHSQNISSKQRNQLTSTSPEKHSLASRQYYYWLKCIKVLSAPKVAMGELSEYGDYQVFDLISWETYVKYSFRLDLNSCQLEASKTI